MYQKSAAEKRLATYIAIWNDPMFSDVVFTFPNYAAGGEMQIFAPVKLLRGFSNYFDMMFGSSGFSESDDTPTEKADGVAASYEGDEEDSDIEKDEILCESYCPQTLPRPRSTYKFVPITHTCYSTYRAALYYLFSNEVAFADVSSQTRANRIVCGEAEPPGGSRAKKGKGKQKETSHFSAADYCTTDPLKVSPKSIYRLAHTYELKELRQLALTNFKTQLTVHTVLLELFSPFAQLYEEVRQACLEYLLPHWDEVQKSPVLPIVITEQGAVEFSLFQEVLAQASRVSRQGMTSASRILRDSPRNVQLSPHFDGDEDFAPPIPRRRARGTWHEIPGEVLMPETMSTQMAALDTPDREARIHGASDAESSNLPAELFHYVTSDFPASGSSAPRQGPIPVVPPVQVRDVRRNEIV
ncbi:hypothetical protein BT69DRAFT_598594 [Atractiella rhizophila]|nr:hypothetical protein BT69DRAFT_598594 [Atractiella rhizophila]